MNNQFGGHERIIATNPSVLQGLDAGGTSWKLGGEWQDLPRLPEVCGAEHVPLFTRRGLSTPSEQHARITGLDHDATGIGQRPFLLDAQGCQLSPRLLLVNTWRAVRAYRRLGCVAASATASDLLTGSRASPREGGRPALAKAGGLPSRRRGTACCRATSSAATSSKLPGGRRRHSSARRHRPRHHDLGLGLSAQRVAISAIAQDPGGDPRGRAGRRTGRACPGPRSGDASATTARVYNFDVTRLTVPA